MIEVFGPFWRVPLDVLDVRLSRKENLNLKRTPLEGRGACLVLYVLQEGGAGGFCGTREKSSEIGDRSKVRIPAATAIISQRGGSPTSEMVQADGIFSGRYSATSRIDVASDVCAVACSTILA